MSWIYVVTLHCVVNIHMLASTIVHQMFYEVWISYICNFHYVSVVCPSLLQ